MRHSPPYFTRHPLYSIWTNMKTRCFNARNRAYPRYGGAGITMCKRWLVFENFAKDMGARPSREHTIDRIDNRKGYRPGNCRWATQTEQQRNRGNNVRIEVDGVVKTASEWTTRLGLCPDAIYMRIRRGWSPEKAATTPRTPGYPR